MKKREPRAKPAKNTVEATPPSGMEEDIPPQVAESEAAWHQQVMDEFTRAENPKLAKAIADIAAKVAAKKK